MKRLALVLLSVLALASPARTPAYVPETGSMSSTTYEEPHWTPIGQSAWGKEKPQLSALEYRAELIALEHSYHGAPVIRIDLRNAMPTERSFVLSMRPNGFAAINRSVILAPNGSASLTFPIFPTGTGFRQCHINNFDIRETTPGSTQATGRIHLSNSYSIHTTEYYSRFDRKPNILMAHALSPESFAKNLVIPEDKPASTPPKRSKSKSQSEKSDFPCQILRFKREAKDWPTDYRVYSTFDAVVVTPALHAAFPPAVRQALSDFSRLGGAVLVTPDNSESGGLSAIAERRRFRDAINIANEMLVSETISMTNSLSGTPMSLKSTVGLEILTPLLVLFAFAFVPYVFIANARRNRRLRALVIIPAVSVGFALVIGVFSLIFYGTTPTERLQSVTLLDQQTHRAITRGQFAVFSPLPLSRELNFPLDSMFSKRSFDYRNEGSQSVEIGDTYRLDGEWVNPLTSAFFDFQRVSRQSEKLDVKLLGDNRVQVVNLLGAKITELRLRAGKRTYALNSLQPGETKVLEPISEPVRVVSRLDLMDKLFGNTTNKGRKWPKLLEKLALSDDPKLHRGQFSPPDSTYYALVEGSPFFPSPFGKRKTHASRSAIVVGTFSETSK